VGEPGVPGGVGVRLGGCGVGPAILEGRLKVRVASGFGALRCPFFWLGACLKIPEAVP